MSQKKILVADDDHAIVTALSVRLKAAGYEVLSALDAYGALDRICHEHPDVAILDIRMPAGDGVSVQERMQRMDTVANIPVIYLTGDKSLATRKRAAEIGAFAIVYKPYDDSELLQLIELAGQSAAAAA